MFVLSSCVFSLFPIYTLETLIFIPEIVGRYENGKEILEVSSLQSGMNISIRDIELDISLDEDEKITEKAYIFRFIENQDTVDFEARIANIKGDYFLDLYPIERLVDDNISNNLFPVHSFMKLEIEENNLAITQFDLEKLIDLFKSNQIRLRHEQVDESIIITAQPKELQKFLGSYSKDERVFDETEVYKRIE